MPVLATSVQEQLETGSMSTANVAEQAPQVNSFYLFIYSCCKKV